MSYQNPLSSIKNCIKNVQKVPNVEKSRYKIFDFSSIFERTLVIIDVRSKMVMYETLVMYEKHQFKLKMIILLCKKIVLDALIVLFGQFFFREDLKFLVQ